MKKVVIIHGSVAIVSMPLNLFLSVCPNTSCLGHKSCTQTLYVTEKSPNTFCKGYVFTRIRAAAIIEFFSCLKCDACLKAAFIWSWRRQRIVLTMVWLLIIWGGSSNTFCPKCGAYSRATVTQADTVHNSGL